MPFFESQKAKTKLVQEPDAEQDQHLDESVKVNNQDDQIASIEASQISMNNPLPSRRTKPVDWQLVLSSVVLSCSVVVPTLLLTIDGASRSYVGGYVQDLCSDHAKAIASFTEALSLRQDPIFYRDRAYAHLKLNPPNQEAALSDLLASYGLNTADSQAIDRAIFLAAKLGRPQVAIPLCRSLSELTFGWNKKSRPYQGEASFYALLLGDSQVAASLVPEAESDKTAKNGYDDAVRALIHRENGQADAAEKIIASEFSDYCSLFCHSDRTVNETGKLVPRVIETLMLLDKKKTSEADQVLTNLQQLKRVKLDTYPVIKLLRAWVCYEKGDYDQCSRLTDSLSKELQDISDDRFQGRYRLSDSVERLNLEAATHLLREHSLLGQKNIAQAEIEHKKYLSTKNTGRAFVPFPYRSWLP